MMKSSVLTAKRKSSAGRIDSAATLPRPTLQSCSAAVLLLLAGVCDLAAATPLPQPRPQTAPKSTPAPDAPPASSPAAAPSAEAPVSACRKALTDNIAIAPSIAAITGPGECGGDDLVRLEAIVLPDQRRIAIRPAATVRCEMASAVAGWVRSDLTAMVESPGKRLTSIENADSFSCRGRNRVAGARLSQHGLANALDIRALRFETGAPLVPFDRAAPQDFRQKLKASLCARFTTVLGPGSDGYHEDHIHLDLAQRRSGYRICQWEIEDKKPDTPVAAAPAPAPAANPAAAAEKPAAKEAPRAESKRAEITPPETAQPTSPAPPPTPPLAETRQPSAAPIVPLPRPRPAAIAALSPAATEPVAAAQAKPAKPKPRKRRAAKRTAEPPFPLSLFPLR